jgi:hypothetical protein
MPTRNLTIGHSLWTIANVVRAVAGTGSSGSSLAQLDQPRGLFVDDNFDLYVVGSTNHHVQRFRSGQSN